MKKALLSMEFYSGESPVIHQYLLKGKVLRFLLIGLFGFTSMMALAQPTVSSVSLDASSPNDLTIDELTVTYTPSGDVTETSTAWVKFGDPEALLQMPCEVDQATALLDFSGNGNDAYPGASPTRIPTWTAGAGYNGSGAFVFDGDDFLNAGNIFPLSSSYTKMAWVNMGGTSYRNILSSIEHDHRNHFFKVDPTGVLNAGHSEGTPIVEDTEALNLGEWYFVAVTFDFSSGEMILYKNGLAVDTETVHDTLRNVEYSSVLIGSMLYSWEWVGAIDEPRIYDHVLSPEQINSFYVNGFDVIVPEETEGYDLWRALVTPFSSTQAGSTVGSNNLRVLSMVTTQIADQTVTEGTAFTDIDLDDYVLDYDFTDDQLTWTYSGNSELGVTINPADNVASISVPSGDWFGSEVITFNVENPNTESHDIVVTFTVESANDAPVIAEIVDQSTDEDVNLTGITVNFTDADAGDTHTITVESSETEVTMTGLTGQISGSTFDLVPDANWNGTSLITVTVTDDGDGTLSDVETFTLTVNAVNDAPSVTEIVDQSTDEDVTLTGIAVNFTDPDAGDTHTITVESSETEVSMTGLTGQTSGSTFDLVPDANWNGTALITVTVTDDGDGTLADVETFTLTVNAVDDAPVISEVGDQDVDEDQALMGLAVTYTDADAGDTHSIDVSSDEANVTVANISGDVSGSTYDLVPAADWNGTAQITVTVTENNGSGLEDIEVYTLTVNPVNDAPDTFLLSNSAIDERVVQGTAVGLFSTVDVDAGDTHTYSFVSDGGLLDVDNGSFMISGDTLKTNAEIDYEVQNSFSILVQSDDGQGGIAVLSFLISVNDIDETAVEDYYNSPAFNVYPVPAVDYVHVEIDNPENKALKLEIYYATGAVVYSEPIFENKRVDLSGFKGGMYIMKISGEKVYGTRKLIVKD